MNVDTTSGCSSAPYSRSISSNSSGSSEGNLAYGGHVFVAFRAGKMNRVGNKMTPDLRKGLVYLLRKDETLHFCWKDIRSEEVEHDIVVHENELEYKVVRKPNIKRVYQLIFKATNDRLYFWMQEPRDYRDDDYCRRVNTLLNKPDTETSSDDEFYKSGQDFELLLKEMREEAVVDIIDSAGPAICVLLNSLDRFKHTQVSAVNPHLWPKPKLRLKRMNVLPPQPKLETTYVHLSANLFNAEILEDIINDPECVKTLASHLPECINADGNHMQQVKDTIASPQFVKAMPLFGFYFQTNQLAKSLGEYQITLSAKFAALHGQLKMFFEALEKGEGPINTLNTAMIVETEEESLARKKKRCFPPADYDSPPEYGSPPECESS